MAWAGSQPARRGLLRVGLAGAWALASGGKAGAASASAQSLAEQFAATLNAHDMDAFAALLADGYLNHQVSAAMPPGPGVAAKQATIGFFAARLAGLPDLAVSIEALVASGDKAAASYVYEGTHSGPYLGVPPTGRRLRFTLCDIFAVRDGQVAEHWGMGDLAGTLAQMRG